MPGSVCTRMKIKLLIAVLLYVLLTPISADAGELDRFRNPNDRTGLQWVAHHESGDFSEYFWRHPFTHYMYDTEDLDSILSGPYLLTITDANECEFTDTAFIEDTKQLVIALQAKSEPSTRWNLNCNGDSDAFIRVKAEIGTATHPIIWEWYDAETGGNLLPSTDSLIQHLPAGTYWAEATDANGCMDPDGRFAVERCGRPNTAWD